MSTELVPIADAPKDLYRISTDAAGLCREIVTKTARKIQGRSYVQVEGWQAIALAHGCTASARDVEGLETGIRAIGVVRRVRDGLVLATAEGFVGNDEKTWASRPEFARRAMAQTRAISRACRSAFAHVVVMMNAGLETTPAEEIQEEPRDVSPPPPRREAARTIDAAPDPVVDQPGDNDSGPDAAGPTDNKFVIVDEMGEVWWEGTDTKQVVSQMADLYKGARSLQELNARGANNATLIAQSFGPQATDYIRNAYKQEAAKLKGKR